jgi:hypothetical protein
MHPSEFGRPIPYGDQIALEPACEGVRMPAVAQHHRDDFALVPA